MAEGDTQHTTFYIDNDFYHYIIMQCGLINARATYQRMVNR